MMDPHRFPNIRKNLDSFLEKLKQEGIYTKQDLFNRF